MRNQVESSSGNGSRVAALDVIRNTASSRLHTSRILRLSSDLPVVIEIVDSQEKINLLLPHLDEMVLEGLVTLEDVQVIKYVAMPEGAAPGKSKRSVSMRGDEKKQG